MKKAIYISDFRRSIALQNRVESIRDYITTGSYTGPCPYQVFMLGDESVDPLSPKHSPLGCVITYESPSDPNDAIDSDSTFEMLLMDMTDPMFKDDAVVTVMDGTNINDDAKSKFVAQFESVMDQIDLESFNLSFSTKNLGMEESGAYGLTAAEIANMSLGDDGEVVYKETEVPAIDDVTDVPDVVDEQPESNNPEEPTPEPVTDDESEPESTKPYTVQAMEKEVDNTEEHAGVKFFKDVYDEFCRLYKKTGVPSAEVVAGALAWFVNSKGVVPVKLDDVTGDEDYSYQNAIPYIERPTSDETQYIPSTESTSFKLEIDPETAKPFRFNVIDDILTGMGEFLGTKPKAAQILTVKETEAFMRKIMKEGVEVYDYLKKKVFTGIHTGYRKRFEPAKDICANYQRPPLAVMNAVRGLVIPVLRTTMTHQETTEFFSNGNLISEFYWTVMHNIRHILIEAKLAKYSSLQVLSFVQKPDIRYIAIVIDTGIQIVTPDEKEELLNSNKAASISIESVQPENAPIEEPTEKEQITDTPDDNAELHSEDLTPDMVFAMLNDTKNEVPEFKDNTVVEDESVDEPTEDIMSILGMTTEDKTELSTESANNSSELTGYDLVKELANNCKTDDELFKAMCLNKDKVGYQILNEAVNINMMLKIKDGIKSANNPSVQSKRTIKILNI